MLTAWESPHPGCRLVELARSTISAGRTRDARCGKNGAPRPVFRFSHFELRALTRGGVHGGLDHNAGRCRDQFTLEFTLRDATPSTPSFTMIGTIVSAATGSAHHQPSVVFNPTPARAMADR